MAHDQDEEGDRAQTTRGARVCWRSWPCASCRGSSTPLGFLVRGFGTIREVPKVGRNEVIDWFKKWEAARLLEWIESCPHTRWTELTLPRLDEGSEHLVLFDDTISEVVKITRTGTYGDYYEIISDRMTQFDSTPAEYLLRMRWWDKLFSNAPDPIGVSETGQIVSRQKFISGAPPDQEAVDRFLTEAGLTAVRRSCWLWKKRTRNQKRRFG